MSYQPEAASQPGPAGLPDGAGGGPAGRPPAGRGRRRHPVLAAVLALVAVSGLAVAGLKISQAVLPRQFTAAEARQIQAWEVGRRWRVTSASVLFPATFSYQLSGATLGSSDSLTLSARRLVDPGQVPCQTAGGDPVLEVSLRQHGCQAELRATYADATGSLVMTVSMLVLASQSGTTAAVRPLVQGGSAVPPGSLAVRPLLAPVAVAGTLAASFGPRQRQLSWVEDFGPYLVVATVGYADGRPQVAVRSDSYAFLEMESFAQGGANSVMGPLAGPVPVPRCPGAPGC